MRRARWKRKHVRRVGLRRRSPPAAGGGRLAVPCGSQRRKRAALGETSSPGRYRDTPCPSPRCRSRSREEAGSAWRSGRRRKRSWSNASLHPDAVGTIRHGTAVTTSQKMIACPKASPNRRLHRYADPRARGGPLHRSAPNAFLFGPCTARFLFHKMEKKMGGASPLDKPPAGADTPLAAVRRPLRTLHSRTASRICSASEAPNSPILPHFSIQYIKFIEYYTNRICFWSLTWKRSR